jgi:hypothetical protein
MLSASYLLPTLDHILGHVCRQLLKVWKKDLWVLSLPKLQFLTSTRGDHGQENNADWPYPIIGFPKIREHVEAEKWQCGSKILLLILSSSITPLPWSVDHGEYWSYRCAWHSFLQLLQQADSGMDTEPTGVAVDGGASLANDGSGGGGHCQWLQQAQQKKTTISWGNCPMMTVPRLIVVVALNILKDMIGEQQGKGEGKDNNNNAFPLEILRLEKKH